MSAPNPGSREAIEAGCLCPRMDNGNGQGSGMLDADGTATFWVAADCPVHGSVASEQHAAWLDGLPADVQNDPALPAAIRELAGSAWDDDAAALAVAYVRRDRQARDRLDAGGPS